MTEVSAFADSVNKRFYQPTHSWCSREENTSIFQEHTTIELETHTQYEVIVHRVICADRGASISNQSEDVLSKRIYRDASLRPSVPLGQMFLNRQVFPFL